MEDYLENLKTLRSQMNDVEEQAAKTSAEEQTQTTAIHTMETDLNSAKSELKNVKEEIEQMVKAKGKICSQIIDKHKRIASLEAESSSISQTLELIQQERESLLAKLQEKRSYYIKVAEEMRTKLQAQQEWVNTKKLEVGELIMVQGKSVEQTDKGNSMDEIHSSTHRLGDDSNKKYQDLATRLDSAKTELLGLTEKRSKLVSECSKKQQSIKELKSRIEDFPPELRAMDMQALEQEHSALLSDKAGEMEYLQTMQCQAEQLKGISHVIKCACGEEYKVDMMTCR